jgi:hypothetical protein
VLSALARATSGERWQTFALEGSGLITRWLPVIKPRSLGSPIGISAEGYWASPTANGLRLLSNEERGVQLLVALEYRLDELRKELAALDSALGAESALQTRFPFKLAVRTAIETGSEEWIARAVAWLEQDRELLDHVTKVSLSAVVANKAYDQKLRQRVDRLSRTVH